MLWWFAGDRRLSKRARSTITAGTALVSVISVWEVELKRTIGRIEIRTEELLEAIATTEGFALLDLTPSHVASLIDLPGHHRDPFDRMLVAQAVRERVPVVTRDRTLARYPIDTIW